LPGIPAAVKLGVGKKARMRLEAFRQSEQNFVTQPSGGLVTEPTGQSGVKTLRITTGMIVVMNESNV
jgi:hypothetical protein